MAWSVSKIFDHFVLDIGGNTSALDLDADTPKIALFDNSITPDRTVTSANSAYAAGVWASGGVSDASGWPAAGRPVVSPTWTASAGVVTYDTADPASANSTTTLAANYGCLNYDDTATTPVADQGISFNYFGGANQVTNGSYTVVVNASGWLAITV